MINELVSIGVPTYNRPISLKRTLESLVNQSYSNLEIIVSDNCSSNKDVDIVLESFRSDGRIKIFRQEKNRGATFNFNFVLSKVKGTYFMRIGDDDWLDSNYIEMCLRFLVENPKYVCAYGRTKLFNLNGEFVKYDIDLSLDDEDFTKRMINYYSNVLQNGIYFGLMRRDCIDLFRNESKIADDWLAVARICFKGKVKMIGESSLNISQGGAGSSIDSIVQSLGLSRFDRFFPYLSVCKNAVLDILFFNPIYRKIRFSKRYALAKTCGHAIYKRFGVKDEFKKSYRAYLKSSFSSR